MRRAAMVLAVLGVCGAASGQTLVGPSTAVLNGSRLGLSVEYGQADADITFDADGGVTENFDLRTAFVGLSAALTDRWELFVRAGGSQADADGFDGDWNFSWGLGTRYTVLQWHDLAWGVLGQFTNVVSDFDTMEVFDVNDGPIAATEELNLGEYVIATGPTWRHDRLCLYGGLFVRYVEGDFEIIAGRFGDQFDVDAQWDFGGYVGGTVTLFRTNPALTYGFSRGDLVGEGRFTSDSTGFSVGVQLPFGGEY
jgi:hypothetical protein